MTGSTERGFWSVVDLTVQIISQVSLVPYRINVAEQKIELRDLSTSFKRRLKCSSLFLLFVIAVCLTRLLLWVFVANNRNSTLVNILLLFYVFFGSGVAPVSLIIAFSPHTASTSVNAINPIQAYILVYRKWHGLAVDSRSKANIGLISFCMKVISYTAITFVPLVAMLFVYLELDPLVPLFTFDTQRSSSLFILSLTLRISSTILIASELLKSGIFMFFIGVYFLYSVNKFQRQLSNFQRQKTWHAQILQVKEVHRGISNVLRSNLGINSGLRILMDYFNEYYCFYLVPTLIFCGVSLIVICNYGTLRLYSALGLPYFLFLPMMSFLILVFSVAIVPESAKVYELSLEYHQRIKQIPKSRYERKVLKSLRRIGIEAGPFFTLKKSINLTIIGSMAYYTMTLLLSFK